MKQFKFVLKLIIFVLFAINLNSVFADPTYKQYVTYTVVNKTNDIMKLYVISASHVSLNNGSSWLDGDNQHIYIGYVNPVGSAGDTKIFNFLMASYWPTDWPKLYIQYEGPGGRIVGQYQYEGYGFMTPNSLHCDNEDRAPNQILSSISGQFSKQYPLYYSNDCKKVDGNNRPRNNYMQQTITIEPVTINVNIKNNFTGSYSFQPVNYYPNNDLMRTYANSTVALNALTSDLNRGAIIQYGLNYFCQMENGQVVCSDENRPAYVTYNLLSNANKLIPSVGCKVQYYWDSNAVCRAKTEAIGDSVACNATFEQQSASATSCIANVTLKENPPKTFEYIIQYERNEKSNTYPELKFVSADPADNYVAGRPIVGQDNVPVGGKSITYDYCLNGIDSNGATCKPNDDNSYTKSVASHKVIYQLDKEKNIGCTFEYSWEFTNAVDGGGNVASGCIAKGIASPNPPSATTKNVECKVLSAARNGDKCVYQFSAKELPVAPQPATTYNVTIKNDTNKNGDGIDLIRLAADQPAGANQNPPDKIAAGSEVNYTYNFSGITQALKPTVTDVQDCSTLKANGVGCVSYGTADARDACLFTYAYNKDTGQCVMTQQTVGNRLNCALDKDPTSPVNGVCTGKPVIKLAPATMPPKAVISVFNNTYSNIVASDAAASVKVTLPSPIKPSLTESFTYKGDLKSEQKFYYYMDSKYPVKCEFTFGWDEQNKKCIANATRVADQYPTPGKCVFKKPVLDVNANACVVNFEMNSNP